MRILWATNGTLPVIDEAQGKKPGYGGGWLVGLSEDLCKDESIQLCVCYPSPVREEAAQGTVGRLSYYSIPCQKGNAVLREEAIDAFYRTIKAFCPDVIHIWGTEYTHSYCAIMAAEKAGMLDSTVVSIQGLVSVIAHYYLAGVPAGEYIFPTLKDMVRRTSLPKEKRNFEKRGEYERLCLKKAKNVIGRTDWDRACMEDINPDARYFFCNETLRSAFYEHTWKYDKCEPHSIFASQAQYPLKGFHVLLQAVEKVKRRYPDVKVYTTGMDRASNSLMNRLRRTTYDRYLHRLIIRLGLEDNVGFLGFLNEQQMCSQFLKANVFVSPSAIENSPNSVGEAMLLGVPVIATDVGGVKNLLRHEEEGLVCPFDDAYVLASYICRVFELEDRVDCFTKAAREHAGRTHNREENRKQMLTIYQNIAKT